MDEIRINIHKEHFNLSREDNSSSHNSDVEVEKEEININKKLPSLLKNRWHTVTKYIFWILAFLLPIWVLPSTLFPLEINKAYLTFALIAVGSIFWVVARIQESSISIPKSSILLSVVFIIAAWLISSIFSDNLSLSFIGEGYQLDTFSAIAFFGILAILFSILFQSEKDVLRIYYLIFYSSIFVFIFQFFQTLFGISLLPFDIFQSSTANLIGSWNEFGIFFGFIALESLILFELLKNKKRKIFFLATLIISLLALMVVNFLSIWFVLGIFSIIFLTYLFSILKDIRAFARLPLFIIILSFLFIISQPLIGNFLSSSGINFLEVRPSWSSTFEVIKKSLEENAILGSGPNTFLYNWLRFKPESINSTFFWATRFQSGIGLIPSFFSTTGILGIIGWFAFFSFLLWSFLKTIAIDKDNTLHVLMVASFFGALYLWVFSIIYVPSFLIFALAFMLTGMFVGMFAKDKKIKSIEFSLLSGPKMRFISALLMITIIILGVGSFYVISKKYAASYYFAKGIYAFNTKGDLDTAENFLKKANTFSSQDKINRALAELGLIRIQQLLNNQNLNADEMRIMFQATLQNTIRYAQAATNQNKLEPLNWMELAKIYESIIPFKISGASEMALNAYKEALKRDPFNPNSLLGSARVASQSGDDDSAKEFLEKAISLKQDYASAHFMLAQIESRRGNIKEAIKKARDAQFLSPNDIGILFQLGLLYYQDKDFESARFSFERAITLNPNYSNARYFLGLIYDRNDEKEKAIEQFEKIASLNPDNQEVKKIISNLKSGKKALENISPPAPSPEKRSDIPLREEKKTESNF
jgi:tetratricopeptide (TPR) repeat protein